MIIPDSSKIQSIDLRVKDLDSSKHFYSYLLGFKEIERKDNSILLSASARYPYIIKLQEDKNVKIRQRNTLGLYHVAIKFPSRKELARVFLRLFNSQIKFQGFSDHLVSESIYLSDPEGNGIELYADKPRDTWKWQYGQIVMDTLPLDLSVLTNELDDKNVWNGIHPDTDIGHVHLSVSDLNKAERFYNEVLGLNITNSTYPGALFFSAGGYHHHVGTNMWFVKNRDYSLPQETTGLINFTIKIPDEEYLDLIKHRAKDADLEIIENNEDLFINDFDKNRIKVIS